jgi:DNA-directed RNA polymerase subunit RPC12/RpoP
VTQASVCIIDQETELEEAGQRVCARCGRRLDRQLVDIGRWSALLPLAMRPGSGSGELRVSGSREAPLPLRVDPLDLGMPARQGAVRDKFGDQTGLQSAATILDSWVRDWREVRSVNERMPAPTAPHLAAWLRTRLPWALTDHEALDEFSGEISGLWGAMRTAIGDSPVTPERIHDVPCKRCDADALFRTTDGTGDIECGDCGRLLTADEFRQWVGLVAGAARQRQTQEAAA